MKLPRLKSLTPRSLIGRTALILLVPILTIQVVVSYVFIQRLYENVTEQMTRSMLPSLRVLADEVERAGPGASTDPGVAALAERLEVDLAFGAEVPEADRRVFYDLSGIVVTRVLRDELDGLGFVDLANPTNRVHFGLDAGQGLDPVRVTFRRNRVSASNPHQLLVLMVFVSTVVTLVSFLFLKNQVRPIRRLADAAAAFGKGRVVPYAPSGASEVRLAGRSFLQMRDRIERHIEQRTLMLSGVSHDLRTPLTRMKLALSMMPEDPEVRALARDVDEMQRMLDTFLGFAQLDATETPEPVDVVALVRDVAARSADDGREVEVRVSGRAETVALRPLAIGRALDNLLRNALRHGERVRVEVQFRRESVRFRVDDNGPGIPEAAREEAVKPFARLDPARNLDRGGSVGLGLSIVRDIARQHGGGLRLGDSPDLGGLRAELAVAR